MKRLIAAILIAVATIVGTAGANTTHYPARVTSTPARGTPQLKPTGTIQQIRQLAHCGKTVYAVGDFTTVLKGKTYTRHGAFSFDATAPYTMHSWNPNINGRVDTITLGDNCRHAYIGGLFTRVHGTAVHNIAEISTATGAVIKQFRHATNAEVETIRNHDGHLLIGGYFTKANGSSRHYMIGASPITGKDDGFVNLHISGTYHYCDFRGCAHDPPRVFNQQISHNGKYDLVEGVFTSVGGKHRQQIVMLNISGKHATVTNWTSPQFYWHCASVESFYIRAAAWGPKDGRVYTASTGYRYDKPDGSKGTPPMEHLCDAAAVLPATQKSVKPVWVNYTGCDSLYSTIAERGGPVWFGGHERWSENRYGCDYAGKGHINAPGMEGLSPRTGRLTANPTRGRGVGADTMILTRAGLWIGSDTMGGPMCGGQDGHDSLCLLKR